MEYTFKDLKKKCVINVSDGKKLGKITDMKITFPQNCVKSFIAENCFSFCGEKYEIGVCEVQKIGADAILVKLSGGKNERRAADASARVQNSALSDDSDDDDDEKIE